MGHAYQSPLFLLNCSNGMILSLVMLLSEGYKCCHRLSLAKTSVSLAGSKSGSQPMGLGKSAGLHVCHGVNILLEMTVASGRGSKGSLPWIVCYKTFGMFLCFIL